LEKSARKPTLRASSKPAPRLGAAASRTTDAADTDFSLRSFRRQRPRPGADGVDNAAASLRSLEQTRPFARLAHPRKKLPDGVPRAVLVAAMVEIKGLRPLNLIRREDAERRRQESGIGKAQLPHGL